MYERCCSSCKVEFETKNKTQSLCRPCNSKKASEWIKNNRQRFQARIRFNKYKITPEQYDEMIKSQNNKCKVCKKDLEPGKKTHIDHDHATGAVRGILCNHCNLALGLIKDDPKILQAMIDYLR